jgi:3-deoxy-D-manno-octulosonate 8-phosphate phosphatase KdsC-like HAD superfamily phosphatase
LYFGGRGESLKVFNVRDGHGIKLLMGQGVQIAMAADADPRLSRRACAN